MYLRHPAAAPGLCRLVHKPFFGPPISTQPLLRNRPLSPGVIESHPWNRDGISGASRDPAFRNYLTVRSSASFYVKVVLNYLRFTALICVSKIIWLEYSPVLPLATDSVQSKQSHTDNSKRQTVEECQKQTVRKPLSSCLVVYWSEVSPSRSMTASPIPNASPFWNTSEFLRISNQPDFWAEL